MADIANPGTFEASLVAALRARVGVNTKNVKTHFGAKGNGSNDDHGAIQAAINEAIDEGGGTIAFPALADPAHFYAISRSLKFDRSPLTNAQIYMVGEGASVDIKGPRIAGNFDGWLIDHPTTGGAGQRLRYIGGLQFFNPHNAGKGILLNNCQTALIELCTVSARMRGIETSVDSYCTQISNSSIHGYAGATDVAGSVGIVASQTGIHQCSIVGWETGITVYNAGFSMSGNRLEVNRTGLLMGRNHLGAVEGIAGSSINGNSWERNDTGILVVTAGGLNIAGNMITGVEGVTDGTVPQYGIRVLDCNGALIGGNVIAGKFAKGGISDESFYTSATTYASNVIGNGGGPAWNVKAPLGKTFLSNGSLVPITTRPSGGLIDPSCFSLINSTGAGAVGFGVRDDNWWNGSGGIPPLGHEYSIVQLGTGQFTVGADTGPGPVTVRSVGGKNRSAGQYAVVKLRKIGMSEWLLHGDLVA